MFSAISTNWRGRPLVSHEVIVELIGATTTRTGLEVHAELDPGRQRRRLSLDRGANAPGTILRCVPSRGIRFARWFVTKPATARQLFTQLGDEIAEVDVEGQRAWLPAADLDEPFGVARDVVRLLPQYDCFVIGSRPREQLLPDATQARIRSYRRGRYEGAVALPTLLVDGLVTGMWERRTRGRQIQITVEATEEFTSQQRRRLETEAARVGAFFGADASLTIGALQ